MYSRISIIGAGSWGVAIGDLLSLNSKVTIFHYNNLSLKTLEKNFQHPSLPGHTLCENIDFSSSKIIDDELCVLAVPVQYMRNVLKLFKIRSKNILILSKGIECETLLFPSDILKEVTGIKDEDIAILSGPSHAELLINKEPTVVAISSQSEALSRKIQNTVSRDHFRAYTNKDTVGVQLGGAIKNVISIASGISVGLGYRENTVSAILTRSLKEISCLGACLNISKETIWSLACIGDLMATSFSKYSRNRNFGINIAKEKNSCEQILSSSNVVIEGVATSKSIFDLAAKFEIEMPICDMVYKIIYRGKNPKNAIKELMTRPLKYEK